MCEDNKKQDNFCSKCGSPLHDDGIPPFARIAIAGQQPFAVGGAGGNLVLSNAGLSSQTTYQIAPPATGTSDTIPSNTSTSPITNKTLDFGLNTISQGWQSPLIARYGDMQSLATAATTGSQGLSGVLSAHTHIAGGSVIPAWDTTVGLYTAYTSTASTANAEAGVKWSAGVSGGNAFGQCRTNFATRMRALVKGAQTANTRFYFGLSSLTSASSVPVSDAPLGSTDSGIFLGYSSNVSSGVWNIYNNNGGQAETITATTGTTASDTNWHTLEINWAAAATSLNVIIDGHAQTAISTHIPANTTNLYLYCAGQSGASASAITYNIKGIHFESFG
jgi:hypothetical protein